MQEGRRLATASTIARTEDAITTPTPSGKRLLVLGAGPYQVPVIRRAQALGCYVITLDYLPGNPGHALADMSAIVSTVDMPAVLDVANAQRIDGVLTYGSDVSAPTVAYVAEALGLPGHGAAVAARLQRKDLFRETQAAIGLPHPAFAAGADAGSLATAVAAAGLRAPFVVKPADSSGSKGQTIVQTADRLAGAFDTARPFSRCGVVIAEAYLPNDTLELVAEVFVKAGRLAFRQYGHNYFLDSAADGTARVPVGEVIPTIVDSSVERQLDVQIQALLETTGLRTGVLNFDIVLSGGVPYLVDIGVRNGGNYLDDLIALSTSFDFTDAAIHAALGIDHPCERMYVDAPRPVVSYILNAHAAGTFDRLEVGDAIRPFVRALHLFVSPGEAVEPFVRGDRALGIALLALPDMAAALALLPELPKHFVVRVR
jgi:phosphoribosylamine-glycine ligase